MNSAGNSDNTSTKQTNSLQTFDKKSVDFSALYATIKTVEGMTLSINA